MFGIAVAVFGARTIRRAVHFVKEIKRRFFDVDSIDADAARSRCSNTIQNYTALLYVCMKKLTRRGFRGPNNFCWCLVHFANEIERRFFDAESTDADASIDRGARKRSKKS